MHDEKEKKSERKLSRELNHVKAAYEKPLLIELGKASKLTKFSSAGPFNDGSSELGRNWKS